MFRKGHLSSADGDAFGIAERHQTDSVTACPSPRGIIRDAYHASTNHIHRTEYSRKLGSAKRKPCEKSFRSLSNYPGRTFLRDLGCCSQVTMGPLTAQSPAMGHAD